MTVYQRWCFFCGFPVDVHEDKKYGAACLSNGFATGLAWVIFVDKAIHATIQDQLGCEPGVWEDGNLWFHFLVEKSDRTCMYNLHRLSKWFVEYARVTTPSTLP